MSSQNLPIEHAAVISEVSLDRQHHHQSHSHCHLEGVNGSGNGNGNGNNKAPVFQWPLSEAITSRKPVVVEGIHEKFRCAFPGTPFFPPMIAYYYYTFIYFFNFNNKKRGLMARV